MVEDIVDEPGPGSSPSCAASHVGPSLRAANMAKELGTFCTSGTAVTFFWWVVESTRGGQECQQALASGAENWRGQAPAL